MPGSVRHGKMEICKFVRGLTDVKTIIDVGPGSGTYVNYIGRDYYWIGVEIFEKYAEIFDYKNTYNKVIIGDVSKVDLPDADLIIFGDVLEHLEKKVAKRVLKDALKRYKHVVVSIPVDGRDGAIHYDNQYEKHISFWTYKDVWKMFTNWFLAFEVKGIGVFCK